MLLIIMYNILLYKDYYYIKPITYNKYLLIYDIYGIY